MSTNEELSGGGVMIPVDEGVRAVEGKSRLDGDVPGVQDRQRRGEGRWLAKAAAWFSRWIVGAILGTFFVGSIVILGWTLRLSRRCMCWCWWRRSPVRAEGVSFDDYLAIIGEGAGRRVPGLVADLREGIPQWRRYLGGLADNVKYGVSGLFNVWVMTLPGCLLWAVAWYAGWLNSFHKGYEQAAIGPLTFIGGIVLFVAAMFYVPMAQMRHAATGEWRSFYQFRFVWSLIRRRWFANLGLAAGYFIASLPLILMKVAPFAIGNTEWVTGMTPPEQLRVITGYYLACSLLIVPLFVLLRLWAASIYAGAVREGVRLGGLTEESVSDREWTAIESAGWLRLPPAGSRDGVWRVVQWMASRTGRMISAVAVAILWVLFVWQILFSEFFNFHAMGRGWLNQPMIQLPWFDHTPNQLRQAAKEVDGVSPSY